MIIKNTLGFLQNKIKNFTKNADEKIYRKYAPLALLYQLTLWERILQKLPLPPRFWTLPQWSCQLQYTERGTKAVVIWDLEPLSNSERQKAIARLASILKEKNRQVAIITESSDFRLFIRNGWLVEYVPASFERYTKKKLAWLALRYKHAASIPLSLGTSSIDEISPLL